MDYKIDGESIRLELIKKGLENEFMQFIKDVRQDEKGLYSGLKAQNWIDHQLQTEPA